LDYGGPHGPHGAGGAGGAGGGPAGVSIFSMVRFAAAIVVILVLLAIFFLIMPRLENVYKDFGVKLPWITMLVLNVSRFLKTPLGWLVAAFIAGIIAVVVAVLPIPRRWLRLLVTFVLALTVIALALAVLLPFLNLMESISGGGTGKK
jgi:type II secretory pathway component PulF